MVKIEQLFLADILGYPAVRKDSLFKKEVIVIITDIQNKNKRKR